MRYFSVTEGRTNEQGDSRSRICFSDYLCHIHTILIECWYAPTAVIGYVGYNTDIDINKSI